MSSTTPTLITTAGHDGAHTLQSTVLGLHNISTSNGWPKAQDTVSVTYSYGAETTVRPIPMNGSRITRDAEIEAILLQAMTPSPAPAAQARRRSQRSWPYDRYSPKTNPKRSLRWAKSHCHRNWSRYQVRWIRRSADLMGPSQEDRLVKSSLGGTVSPA